MCLKRFAVNVCPNCSGHLASIDNGLRECEQCGRIEGDKPMSVFWNMMCEEEKRQGIESSASLLERDNHGPVFNWPETVFARRNTLDQQLTHIISEMDEIDEAGPYISHTLLTELADLHHSLETFWRILVRKAGEDLLTGTFSDVERKNRKRGYYNLTGEPDRVDHIEGPFGQMPNLED